MQFYKYDDASVRYTGRFAEHGGAMTATACGSTIEIAFCGDLIVMDFDTSNYENPVPHIYYQLDGGSLFESPIYDHLRIKTTDGEHLLKIIYKSAVEMQNRFPLPLVGKIAFLGYTADKSGILPPDNRKSIEFVGDSITEGVLTDADCEHSNWDQPSRPHVDDVTSTYAYITAQHFNLKDLHMGYGAVGVTHGGCGGVPKAADAYPYCFSGAPVTYPHPDYIVINHGANDKWSGDKELYLKEYENLLTVIRKAHPNAVIIALSAFCKVWPEELKKTIEEFNSKNGDNVAFIDASLWVPAEPLHPLRTGHKIIAEKLINELEGIIK